MSRATVPDPQTVADAPAPPDSGPSDGPAGAGFVWLGAAIAVLALWLQAGGSIPTGASRWLSSLLLLVAGQTIWVVARRTELSERRSWQLLASAVAVAAVSRLMMAVLGSTLDGPGAWGGLVSVLVAVFPLLAALGLLSLPRMRGSSHQDLRIWLEAAGASVAAAALAWEYLLPEDPDAGAAARTLASLPPMLEVALLGAMIVVLLRRSPFRRDRRVLSVCLGLALLVMADLFAPTSRWESLTPTLDLAAAAALILVGYYGRQPQITTSVVAAPTDWWRKLVPFGMMLSLYAVLFWKVTALDRLDVGVLPWAALVVFLLMVVRQAAGMEENRELVELERDHLITAFSHELRAPLTAVAGFAEVLAGGWRYLSEGERTELLGIVRDQSGQLVGIVDDMTLVVRDELADARLHRVRLDGKQVIAHAIRSVFDLNRGPLPVKAEVEPYLELIADRRRLVEMLVNLLKNAQRYGDGRILIVAKRSADGRVIEVHDDGEGLPPRHEALVWQRFERGAHRLNDSVPGSGLGLSIVRALAEAHGGSAGYRRSARLGGACFFVELPYDVDLEVARDATAATA